MRSVYAVNILVAGTVGTLSLFAPDVASRVVWEGTARPSNAMQMTGALWSAIAILSVAGLFAPQDFAVVLLLQLIYKASWLIVVALPAVSSGARDSIPQSMATFFVAWVVILPFVIPWQTLFP